MINKRISFKKARQAPAPSTPPDTSWLDTKVILNEHHASNQETYAALQRAWRHTAVATAQWDPVHAQLRVHAGDLTALVSCMDVAAPAMVAAQSGLEHTSVTAYVVGVRPMIEFASTSWTYMLWPDSVSIETQD